MAQKLKQNLKQQQRLSPQQILTIRLLELPTLEIEDRIKTELEENPALEEGKEFDNEQDTDYEQEENTDSEEDISLGDYLVEDDIPDYKLAEFRDPDERRDDIPFSGEQSLTDYLLQQLQLADLSDEEKQFGEYLIGNIDNDGYLRRNLAAIADDIAFQYAENVSVKELQKILAVIQDFDPPGIAACNLQECLMIQLKKRKPSRETDWAKEILSEYFDKFSKRHFDRIQKELKISDEQMKSVIHEITSLNPKPGGNWDDTASAMKNRITPDFIVETHNAMISLTLNNRGVPDLRINREYVDMLKDYTGNKANQNADMRDAVLFVKQKIDAAQGFIEAIKQRQDTLQRTMEAIINMQQDFFLTGDESRLHPMILKDVAGHTGLDIATISRVSNSKYVQTNFGVYPLKFFFSESAQTQSGEVISTRKIKQIIEHEVAGENKQKPLTDDELTAMLKAKGFMTARRTVAKYREQLGIPVARLRRGM
ncbi:MAG: RNA polymerase factor sigma-54 [Tannerella sp.]|jgi:RNA polymerase sigma-54 factor|nr:RNA polymerase factor sigma-54 [Tannerella sp.]